MNSYFKRMFMLSSLVVTAFFTSVLPAAAADDDDGPAKVDDPVSVYPEQGQDLESNPMFTIKHPDRKGLVLEISTSEDFSTLYYVGKDVWTATSKWNIQSYQLPLSYFDTGVYFWRVRATFPGVLDGVSETRVFTVGMIQTASETAPEVDPYEYAAHTKGFNDREYTLKNIWMHRSEGSRLNTDPGLYRDMVTRSADDQPCDMIYLVARTSDNDSAESFLLRYDAMTGKALSGMQLSYDDRWIGGTCPANGVLLDGDNQLVVHNLAKAGTYLSVGTVDPATGAVKTWFSHEVAKQVDHIDVYGTIADGETWYIFAPSVSGTLYRITMEGGNCENIEEMSVTLGNGARVHAVSPTRFWADGHSTHPGLFEFGNRNAISNISDVSELIPTNAETSGVTTFTHDGESYILYQYGTYDDYQGTPNQWALAAVGDATKTASDAQLMWVFPRYGYNGEMINIADRGAPVSVLHTYASHESSTLTSDPEQGVDDDDPLAVMSIDESEPVKNTYLYGYVYGQGLAAYSFVKNTTTAAIAIATDNEKFQPGVNPDGTISLGADGTYQVYSTSGALVATGTGAITKPLSAKGVYVVRVNSATGIRTAKVAF